MACSQLLPKASTRPDVQGTAKHKAPAAQQAPRALFVQWLHCPCVVWPRLGSLGRCLCFETAIVCQVADAKTTSAGRDAAEGATANGMPISLLRRGPIATKRVRSAPLGRTVWSPGASLGTAPGVSVHCNVAVVPRRVPGNCTGREYTLQRGGTACSLAVRWRRGDFRT